MRKNYLWYELFRYGIVGPALSSFHPGTQISGIGHVPDDKPVLFIPNHQNSFIDALQVVCNTRSFIHFLTRSDPFEVPVLGWFLRTLNMLPVYRVRDGFSSIKKNEEIFERCFRYLGRNDAILVFAEASHDLRRRVRPLSKGFTRIAFGAEERYDWELDLQVIPVGINYDDHRKSCRPVHVRFGEGIPVLDFKELYAEDPRKAAMELKKTTSEGMKRVTMHVASRDHYPLHHVLLDELEHDRTELLDPDTTNRRVAIIEEQIEGEWVDEAEKLLDEAKKSGVDLNDFVSPVEAKVKDLLLSPFYLFSFVNNLVPYLPARWLLDNTFDDVAFDASIKFLSGLVIFPLFYICVAAVFGLSGLALPYVMVYLVLSLFTAPMFVRVLDLFRGNSLRKLRKEDPERYKSIKAKVDRFLKLRESLFGDRLIKNEQ